ncbi:hypothetical protein PGT21_032934 [Puccinia graminis f. sp. tritici]|uniref:Uncharacterized protein n=1 Tax=Puccinia graminis f. sp. tritici TaxID=56615 RepID=A0A5B0PCD6_PUCGR|nr:hypothetical protein PGT21_032934 [Puccinia graminis f. sp. tritici]
MGNLIYRWNLLPSDFFQQVQTFKQHNVTDMVEFHIRIFSLMSSQATWWERVVIPQLGFLTTNKKLIHFHRSIEALSNQDRKIFLHQIMKVSFERYKNAIRDQEIASVFQYFSTVNLEDMERLSCNINNKQKLEDFSGIIIMIFQIINFFQNHESKEHMGLLFAYSFLDYIDTYYQPIMIVLKKEMDEVEVFEQQLHIMGLFIKGLDNDIKKFNFDHQKEEIQELLKILKERESQRSSLGKWILVSTHKIIGYDPLRFLE